jgi:hypothetical protein
MNNKIANVAIFILGTGVGSVLVWKYVRKKYERIAQKEIDSVKDVFSKRSADFYTKQTESKPNITEYTAKLHEQGYVNYSNTKAANSENPEPVNDSETPTSPDTEKPYVITPEEFGEFYDYEKISLVYYADQILADDNDELVEDVENIVGFESLTFFGEYEDDSVFVRNDKLKCDYEILLDQGTYSDVIKKKPHKTEV